MSGGVQWGRVIAGALIVFLGLGIALDQMDVWNFKTIISDWWPLLLVLIGAVKLSRRHDSPVAGGLFIAAGLFLLGKKMDLLPDNIIPLVWSALIIMVGLWIIFGRKRSSHWGSMDESDRLDKFCLFSGLDTRIESQDFQGGSVTALFGGAKIDLRNSRIAGSEVYLDLNAAFGGIEIFVPADWKVEVKGLPLFGGYDNKTRPLSQDGGFGVPVLKVRCLAIFGGIDVKN